MEGNIMSALAINTWGTSAYAPEARKPKPRTAETVSAGAFARRERVAPVIPQHHHPRILQIPVGSQEIKLIMEDGTTMPSWFGPVIGSMSERWGVLAGWDSYDARPTDLQHAIKLLNHLSQILPDKAKAPIITPLADGGLQAEWHRGGKDMEIVVPFGEPARYYYFDAETDLEEEEELAEGNIAVVRNHINSL